jgi:hypothetical protein
MKFVGDTVASARVQDAVEFIYNNWDTDPEHFASNGYYTFYSVMKGFRLLGIQTIHPINDPSGFDWYDDPARGYAQYIVNDQQPDGAWDWGWCSQHPLTSAWAILTLKKTVVQPGPVADAGPDVPSHPPLIEITFDGTGSYHRDPSRSIVKYEWDFGDGSPPEEGPIVTHAYPAVFNPDGTIDWGATVADYTVTLTVTDDNSPALTDSDTCVVHITPPPWPPVADANGPYTAYECTTLTLDGSGSYDPNGALYPDPEHPWHGYIVSWEWDLDNDGEYDDATGETMTWSSCALGLHVVGLKVTNNFEESDEADTVINVVERPPEIGVSVDIKPGSCPNSFDVKSKGVLPVAVLGTMDFDVTTIDPGSIRLTREPVDCFVQPIRWSYEDVATPFEGELCDCHDLNGDGYMDLTLKFDTQELVSCLALEEVAGETIPLTLTGNLKEEDGGTPITGEDCLRILNPGGGKK